MGLRAPWWSWLLLVTGLVVLGGLGVWQLHRAQAKKVILKQRQAASNASAVPLARAGSPERLYRKHVVVTGNYLANRQILMDSQTYHGQVGYHAWTPLKLPDGRLVMVDRGWVPRHFDREHLPTPPVPAGPQKVFGIWRDWPEAGIALHTADVCARHGWPRVLLYPQYKHVACQYRSPVVDGLLLLSEDAEGGFPRNWQNLWLSPMRHIGYAVQWFAMAAAALVIFVVINVRRNRITGGPA